MEQQKNGQAAGNRMRTAWEGTKKGCRHETGCFSKMAVLMVIAGMLIFFENPVWTVYAAETARTETTRGGYFSGSSEVKENKISLAKVGQEKTATLVKGRTFNESIKTMAAGKDRDTYRSDNLIKAIIRCTDRDAMSGKAVKELQEDGELVYGWFEDGTIYVYTDADMVYLNEDCSGMFRYCEALGDFSGISDFNASRMKSGYEMFIDCCGLITADSFHQWDTGSLENMQAMFAECRWLQDISGLSKWDVSHVTTMGLLFSGCCFRSLESLSEWDVGLVENISGIFADCYAISNLDALSGWDVGSVTGMNYAFETCVSLSDVTGIAGWDTSKVERVDRLFMECGALTDASSLSGWDMGNVTNMSDAFSVTGITDASGYPSWYSEYGLTEAGLRLDAMGGTVNGESKLLVPLDGQIY